MLLKSFFFVVLLLSATALRAEVLLSTEQFIREAFSADVHAPKRETLWIDASLKEEISQKIAYQFHALRVRYWGQGQRTAWVLEEVGKEEPITMGVVVEGDKLIALHILVYRESRGDEVKHSFYTKQFKHASLQKDRKRYRLSQPIDGITGATLSVRATKKVAKLALLLHQQTPYASQNTHGEKK